MASEKTLALRALEAELATKARPLPTLRDVGGDAVLLHEIDHRSRKQRREDEARARKGGKAYERLASVTGHNERTASRRGALGPLEALAAFKAGQLTHAQAKVLGAFDKAQRLTQSAEKLVVKHKHARKLRDRSGNGNDLTQASAARAPKHEPGTGDQT